MLPARKILIVDDESQLRRLLKVSLEMHGYYVIEAASGEEALRHAKDYLPDAVILDLGLPDKSGLEVLRELRQWTDLPVIILSVQNEDEEKIFALDMGANDYVTKPYSANELLARIRASLRITDKKKQQPEKLFRIGNLEIDLSALTVKRDGKDLHLTATEFALLKLFLIHAGSVLTHKQILKEVWGPNHEAETHYLRVYVGSLRKKIEVNPQDPKILTTEPGIGYRFRLDR